MAQSVGVVVLVALAVVLLAGMQGVALLGAGGGDHRIHVGVGGLCRGQRLTEEHLHPVGGVGGRIVKDTHRHGHIIAAQNIGPVSLRTHPQLQEPLGRGLALDVGDVLPLIGVGAGHRREAAAAVGAGMGKDLGQLPGAGIGSGLLRCGAQGGEAVLLTGLVGQRQDIRSLDRGLDGRLGRGILSVTRLAALLAFLLAALLAVIAAGLGGGLGICLLLVPYLDGAAALIAAVGSGGVRCGGLRIGRHGLGGGLRIGSHGLGGRFRRGRCRGLGCGLLFLGHRVGGSVRGGFRVLRPGFLLDGIGLLLIDGGRGGGFRGGAVLLGGLDGDGKCRLRSRLGTQGHIGDGADSQQSGGHDGCNGFPIHDFSLFLAVFAGLVVRIAMVRMLVKHDTFLLKPFSLCKLLSNRFPDRRSDPSAGAELEAGRRMGCGSPGYPPWAEWCPAGPWRWAARLAPHPRSRCGGEVFASLLI